MIPAPRLVHSAPSRAAARTLVAGLAIALLSAPARGADVSPAGAPAPAPPASASTPHPDSTPVDRPATAAPADGHGEPPADPPDAAGAAAVAGGDAPAALPPGNALGASIAAPQVTVDGARRFVAEAERDLALASRRDQRANWLHDTYITEDTEALASEEDKAQAELKSRLADRARAWDGLSLDTVLRRKLDLLKRGALIPAPRDGAQAQELAQLAASMSGQYGAGEVCPADAPAHPCRRLDDLEQLMATSRDPQVLLEAWEGWHRTARRYRDTFSRFVDLADQGSREAGDADLGVHWRSNYDLPPEAFAADMERLWQQVEPLYRSLHTYVRNRLVAHYGDAARRDDGQIPAHLLGNMWAQSWGNLMPLLDAPPGADDLTPALQASGTDPKGLVRTAEAFFLSLGFDPLPPSFWTRSMFVRPRDREVVCHASAWDLDDAQDVRIKMCIRIDEEHFVTAHHELGHDFYDLAYAHQPFLFRDSANDGFHEAIGDTIALSVTPDYLKALHLIDRVPGPEADIALLLRRALDKVAFLPFAYLVDQWRWRVFAGEVGPDDYDRLWWSLRSRYQGIVRPVPAEPGGFDAGAKYHVAGNVPYARYFLADILQFQFHRALCREAGYSGPLHRCSIYGNKAAGERLRAMLSLGESLPWPEALKAMTGEDQLDASALIDYFAPLKAWLDARNAAAAADPPPR